VRLRLLAALGCLALSGCGGGAMAPAKAPTPAAAPRDIPSIPRNFTLEVTTRRKVDRLKLRVYNTGSVTVRGAFVSSMKSWSSKAKLDMPAFLIKHPREGYVLFDTGLQPEFAVDGKKVLGRLNYWVVPFTQQRGQDLVAQLKADGVDPSEIRWVVVSHMHLDHTGMLDAFPSATVIADKREWEAQRERKAKKKLAYEPDPAALEQKLKVRLVDLSSAPSFGSFDHAQDLFGDGSLQLIEMSGHTAGSLGLWAGLDDGPVLLAGDATWILDNHQDLALPIKREMFSVDLYWRRLYQMKYMQEALPRLVIFPGHDLQPLTLQPRADVTLAPFPR
jgi:N-acyl homoserine lactone hydrolase